MMREMNVKMKKGDEEGFGLGKCDNKGDGREERE